MAYRLPERRGRIRFDGTEYDGAEVVVTLNVKIGVYRQIVASTDQQDLDTAIAFLCQFVREWNLEDEAGPIPVSPEGFDRIDDVGFLRALLDGWVAAMQGETSVPAPLGERSTAGVTSTSETPPASPPESSET